MGGRSVYEWDLDDSRRRRRVNAQPLSALGAREPWQAQPPQPPPHYDQRAQPGTFGAWRQHARPEPQPWHAPAYEYDGGPAYAPQPQYEQPQYEQAYYQPSTYQPPAYQQPSYQSPSYQPPSYQQPSYQPPAYRQARERDSAWLTDQAPVAPPRRPSYPPASPGQGYQAYQARQPWQPPPEEDESWLQDTQEDQVWEFTAWQERVGGQRPERARGGGYDAPAHDPNPWRPRHDPAPAYGAWGRAPERSPDQYADDGASRPYSPAGAYDAFGAPPARPTSEDWTYSREGGPATEAWRYGAWDERSGGYEIYGEEDDAGPWDEETAELPAPRGSSPRFVNMRARASVMPEFAEQWGRARPEASHPAHSPRPSWLHRLLGRHSRSEVKLPPAWVTLNLLILLVVGVIAAPHVFAAEHHSCGWYTVEPGDTVSSLAQRYHATAKSIGEANHLTDSQRLTEGQRLCIPSQAKADTVIAPVVRSPSAAAPKPTPSAAAPTPTPKPTPTPAKAAPTPKPGAVSGVQPFIKFVLPYAKRAHAQTGWPTSVIIAQWGVEHGWKLPSFTGYNFGNVASVPGEPTIPGTAAKGSPSRFSYARTPEDGLRQYVKVARLSYYAPVTAAVKSGANSCAVALGKSPWDAGHYGGASNPGSTLLGVMKSFNLYAYDK